MEKYTLKAFSAIYSDFYEHGYNSSLTKEFDSRIGNDADFTEFMNDLVNARKDFISSDREAATATALYHRLFP